MSIPHLMTSAELQQAIEFHAKLVRAESGFGVIHTSDTRDHLHKLREIQLQRAAYLGDANRAIDFATSISNPKEFLNAWREGDVNKLLSEWPDFQAY